MRNIFKRTISVLIFFSFSFLYASEAKVIPVKYVFLFIGDGMSLAQIRATEEYLKLKGEDALAFASFEDNAITTTHSADSIITDSAASGTAIACGVKTNNNVISLDVNGDKIDSIATVAKANDKKVGIITSVTINHATPAVFFAHNISRKNYYEIALDMCNSNFDFLAGGSIDSANDETSSKFEGNAYDIAKSKGYKIIINKDDFAGLKATDDKIMAFGSVISLDANTKDDDWSLSDLTKFGGNSSLSYAIDATESDCNIADFTRKAIDVLDNDNGFFIMAEGGKIDWACHANDAMTTIKEVMDFDNAIKVALEFAEKHPEETLIVVTADHETGGMSLGSRSNGKSLNVDLLEKQTVSFEKFTKILTAESKQNPKFNINDTKALIEEYIGLKFKGEKGDALLLRKSEQKEIEELFANSLKDGVFDSSSAKKFTAKVISLLNTKASISWGTSNHTALPVITYAKGKNSKVFNGTIDNTDIAKLLKKAVK